MVNKGSFFQRLKDRWSSGSGVRIEKTTAHAGSAARSERKSQADPASKPAAKSDATAERIEPNGRSVSTGFVPAEARSSRKMSDREEAMLAVGTHFQELTALMRGSQAKTDEKLQKLVDATSSLGQLPVLGQQQLETLQSLSKHMERQNQLGEQLSTTMTKLPSMLENVEKALQRAAATDERTAATVKEFQSTMDRIHGSMDKMVQTNGDQARAAAVELKGLAGDISKSHESSVEELRRTTDEGLKSLRRTHEDQSNRLQRVVQEHAGWSRAVLVGVGLVVIGIGAVIVLQLIK